MGNTDPVIAIGLIVLILIGVVFVFRLDKLLLGQKKENPITPKIRAGFEGFDVVGGDGTSMPGIIPTDGQLADVSDLFQAASNQQPTGEVKVNEKYDLNELYQYSSGAAGNVRIALRRRLNENHNVMTEFQYILMGFAGFLVCGLFGLWLYPHALTFLIGAVCGTYLPEWWLKKEKRAYHEALEKQAINLTQLVVQGLHAGLGLVEAIQGSGGRLGPPISLETDFIAARVSMGTPFEDAIDEVRKQTPSKFMNKMYTILLVGKRNGLDDETIRDRLSLIRQSLLAEYHLRMAMKAAANGGIMSKNMMMVMIPGIIIFVFKRSPDVLMPLFSGGGLIALFAGIGMYVGATIASNKIIAKLDF